MPWNGGRPSGPNPRRPPAHLSVSLCHTSAEAAVDCSNARQVESKEGASRNKGSHNTPLFDGNSNGSPSSCSRRLSGRDGSGKSSNADDWFFQLNNESRVNVNFFADDDPPFYIRKSSSSDSVLENQQQQQWPRQGPTADPMRRPQLKTGVLQLGDGTNVANNFQSIIDDLKDREQAIEETTEEVHEA